MPYNNKNKALIEKELKKNPELTSGELAQIIKKVKNV